MKEPEKMNKENASTRCLKGTQKSIYILGLLSLSLVLLVQIYNCLLHYANEPTYVETKIASQNKALFPAMTICAQNNRYNEDTLKVIRKLFYQTIV